jgi:hypothetical protein
MTKQDAQRLLCFAAGFALAAVLSMVYDVERFVPVSVVFGLLCFGCGVVLTQFLTLRSREEEFRKANSESLNRWAEQFKELEERKRKYDEEESAP